MSTSRIYAGASPKPAISRSLRNSIRVRATRRKDGSGVQGGRQDLRSQGLSGYAARLQRRLPAELPRRTGEGRLVEDARLVQAERRRLITPRRRGPARRTAGRGRARPAV